MFFKIVLISVAVAETALAASVVGCANVKCQAGYDCIDLGGNDVGCFKDPKPSWQCPHPYLLMKRPCREDAIPDDGLCYTDEDCQNGKPWKCCSSVDGCYKVCTKGEKVRDACSDEKCEPTQKCMLRWTPIQCITQPCLQEIAVCVDKNLINSQ